MDAFKAALAQARRAMIWGLSLRLLGPALGLAALLTAAGWTHQALSLALLCPILVVAQSPRGRRLARRLDAVHALGGEVECAFDHHLRGGVYAEALCRAAVAHLKASPYPTLKRPPLWYFLPIALWLWPALTPPTPPVTEREQPALASTDAPHPVSGAAMEDAGAAADPQAAAALDAGKATAERVATPPSLVDDAGLGGGGTPTAKGEVGGVGARAGTQTGGAVGRLDAERIERGHTALTIGRGVGTQQGGSRAALAPPTGAAGDLDDIADPARPYPLRYHKVVSAWFGR